MSWTTFKTKGSKEDLDKLITLFEKKDISRKDITLILSTLELDKNRSLDIDYPDFISKEVQNEIKRAVKNNTPIIINGRQGSTGKTTLCNLLKKYGINAYEEYECCVITLNELASI